MPNLDPIADSHLFVKKDVLQRIVGSSTFVKSDRLCAFLLYVGEVTLQGRAAELNEQNIGHAVFGRKRDYDSAADSIVRTQASRLRKRLETFYQNEGASEIVRVSIPRGSYVPQFLTEEPHNPQPTDLPTYSPALSEPLQAPIEPVLKRMTLPLLAVLCVALLVAVLVLLWSRYTDRAQSGLTRSSTNPLWQELFLPGTTTMEIPGDSGLVLYHAFDGRNVTLNEYLIGAYRHPDAEEARENPSLASSPSADFANRRYTGMVDLDSATAFTRLAVEAHSAFNIRYARDVRPSDLKSGNVILVGAAEANPWVELYERNMNFTLHDNYQTHIFTVLNKAPLPGEPASWNVEAADPLHHVFGVIAFLHGLSGEGKALIVEGTSMAGTEAALDFALDDSLMLPILKGLKRRNHQLPPFELLVTTQNTSASAVRTTLVAMRTAD